MTILLYYTCKNTVEEKLAKLYDTMLLIQNPFCHWFLWKIKLGNYYIVVQDIELKGKLGQSVYYLQMRIWPWVL
jgi:hypothetical protein